VAGTVTERLDRAAAHPGCGIRVLDRAEQAEFAAWPEIRRRALSLCGGLQRLGVRRGDRVAIVFPTGLDFVEVLFGTLLAGAVPVPLYPPVRLGRLDEYFTRTARMLELVEARVVLVDPLIRRLIGPAVEPARPPLGCLRPAELDLVEGDPAPQEPEDLVLVQFSSGTTVDPKPVALSHRAVVTQTEILNSLWPDTDELTHSGVSWLPLYHDMGLIGCLFLAVDRPGTMTLIPPELFLARPALWLRAISSYRATFSAAPNFAFGLCLDRIRDDEMEGVDLSCWRLAVNGAEPVAPRVLHRFVERFGRWGFPPEAMIPVYGLSEAALAVTFSESEQPAASRRFDRGSLSGRGVAVEADDGVEIFSLGLPLPGFGLRVVGGDGADLSDGEVGRVLVRGPSLMEGYVGQPEATARAMRDGWLDSGDLGFLLDGELFLTGRIKDVLILRGRNHSPHEVEDAVNSVAGVRTGCAVAVSWMPEGADGELLLVLVEVRRDVQAGDLQAIADGCASAVLASTGLAPDQVVVLESGTLPRTSSGKFRRHEALRRWLAGELKPPQKVTAARMVGAMARSSLALARMRRIDGREE
jgi:acyl-CoA synthetase (AMP-forming)/AMP-acid ligase II